MFESNINVNKFTKEVESIRIKSTQDEPMYGKGVVRVQYPHPLNAKELKLEHSFGVYVIDQVRVTAILKCMKTS